MIEGIKEELIDISNKSGLEKAVNLHDKNEDEVEEIKIVDMEADKNQVLTAEDIAGKYMVQCDECKQLICPTIDQLVVDNNGVITGNFVCPTCNNETQYTLIGKVDEKVLSDEERDIFADLFIEDESEQELEEDLNTDDNYIDSILEDVGYLDKVEKERYKKEMKQVLNKKDYNEDMDDYSVELKDEVDPQKLFEVAANYFDVDDLREIFNIQSRRDIKDVDALFDAIEKKYNDDMIIDILLDALEWSGISELMLRDELGLNESRLTKNKKLSECGNKDLTEDLELETKRDFLINEIGEKKLKKLVDSLLYETTYEKANDYQLEICFDNIIHGLRNNTLDNYKYNESFEDEEVIKISDEAENALYDLVNNSEDPFDSKKINEICKKYKISKTDAYYLILEYLNYKDGINAYKSEDKKFKEDVNTVDPVDKPIKLEEAKTLDDVVKFLVADEVSAIDGYSNAIAKLNELDIDEKDRKQYTALFEHLISEEEHHINELEAGKQLPDVDDKAKK